MYCAGLSLRKVEEEKKVTQDVSSLPITTALSKRMAAISSDFDEYDLCCADSDGDDDWSFDEGKFFEEQLW